MRAELKARGSFKRISLQRMKGRAGNNRLVVRTATKRGRKLVALRPGRYVLRVFANVGGLNAYDEMQIQVGKAKANKAKTHSAKAR